MVELRHAVEHGMLVRHWDARSSLPPLVWIHGLGESGLCFEEVVRAGPLRDLRHLIPDLPGYGRSPWPRQAAGIDDSVRTLVEWLADLPGPLVLVGHSLGGVIGLRLAETLGARVRLFVDIEGNKSLGDCTYSRHADGLALEAFAATVFPALLTRVQASMGREPAYAGYYVGLRLCDVRTFHRQAQELVALSRSETLATELSRLAVPKLYVAGVPGGAAPRSLELAALARVPTCRIEPAGHWPFVDQPAAFAAAIAAAVATPPSGA